MVILPSFTNINREVNMGNLGNKADFRTYMSRLHQGHTHTIEKTRCNKCQKEKAEVEERYSFGVYAGIFCRECCFTYRDHCGIDQPQGSSNDLDEQYEEDY
tara:strand:+ start:84 stop:386 length:303 start_codon:yes stop_codon:yes gene_type:complete